MVDLDEMQAARRLAAEVQHDYRQASQPKIKFEAAAGAHALARLAPHIGHHGFGRVQAMRRQHVVDFSFVDDLTFARINSIGAAQQRREAREAGKDEEPIGEHGESLDFVARIPMRWEVLRVRVARGREDYGVLKGRDASPRHAWPG